MSITFSREQEEAGRERELQLSRAALKDVSEVNIYNIFIIKLIVIVFKCDFHVN